MRRAVIIVALAVLPALTGCSTKATLTGKVSYKGRTVTSGSVIVLNDDGTAESGVIHPDGTYVVEGVKKGHVRLGVFSPNPAHARSILNPEDNRSKAMPKGGKSAAKPAKPAPKLAPADWFPIPLELGDPEKSGLSCDVDRGQFEFNIDIN